MSKSAQLFVCIENHGYAASLERRKIYVAVQDPDAETQGLLRVIDESGDDYLYPKNFFRPIELPQALKKAILAAA
ncbi:MAG: hypothetical protein KGO48_13740 [Alphaproteobacteria bacterium]|nr:hypothetical protein [Alphaproteobacteria bacterium]